jgi:2TM domain-containing protein
MSTMNLERYQQAEREAALEEGVRGFRVHSVLTGVVLAVLIVLNATVADEFPWAIFPVVGMSIGLWAHWFFGVAHSDELMRRRQQEIERRIPKS